MISSATATAVCALKHSGLLPPLRFDSYNSRREYFEQRFGFINRSLNLDPCTLRDAVGFEEELLGITSDDSNPAHDDEIAWIPPDHSKAIHLLLEASKYFQMSENLREEIRASHPESVYPSLRRCQQRHIDSLGNMLSRNSTTLMLVANLLRKQSYENLASQFSLHFSFPDIDLSGTGTKERRASTSHPVFMFPTLVLQRRPSA